MFYESLLNNITKVVVTAINGNVEILADILKAPFYSMVTLYFAWWGYKLLFGESENFMKDFANCGI